MRWVHAIVLVTALVSTGLSAAQDWRNIYHGNEIPSAGYVDMPLVVTLNDGSWLCVMTTGPGEEGNTGQHIVSTRSTDRGETWSDLVAIEPAIKEPGHESSWVVPFHVEHQGNSEFGRTYVFYVHNGERVTEVPDREDSLRYRVDKIGWYLYRFSDDAGTTWSEPTRIVIPLTWADMNNTFSGEAQMFWGVDEPIAIEDRVLIAFTKIRRHLVGSTEGWVLESSNLLTETDPSKHKWRLLSNGQTGNSKTWRGLRSETNFAGTQAEHDITKLSQPGRLMMMNRTDKGVISVCWSSDGGETWTEPEAATYADGSVIRNPRANTKVWTIEPGKYLLWFHNHGGIDFNNRNPGWASAGVEHDGEILWSQPEILLYDNDPKARISYPDLIVEDRRYFITETQKSVARVHELDRSLIEGMFMQFDNALNTPTDSIEKPGSVSLHEEEGLTISASVSAGAREADSIIAECASQFGARWSIKWHGIDRIEIELRENHEVVSWLSDPIPIESDLPLHIVMTIDGGPRLLTLVINGKLHDGAGQRQYGWARIPDSFDQISLSPSSRDEVVVFGRPLTTSEALELYKASRP
ncbi:MAG: exo-alpha-sialidase [Phycisphaera sp.]|nr:MAG: exo-alpha-sialidase [Phycisphaera sp.]